MTEAWLRYGPMDSLAQVSSRLNERFQAFARQGDTVSAFTVRLPNGKAILVGHDPSAFVLNVRDRRALSALVRFDQLALAEAFVGGSLEVEGSLEELLAMRRFFNDRRLSTLPLKFIRPILFGQTRSDRAFIARHYDEDAEFFETFLDDRHRCYSHGIFTAPSDTIEDAMTRKMDWAFEAVGLKRGDHVLEVGGGWGAFAAYAARRGVDVTVLTISGESKKYMDSLMTREGLAANVIMEHLYEFKPHRKYDAIVAMGVTEHLPNYTKTVRCYERLLRVGGKVYLDAVAMPAKYRLSSFMTRHIYPGNASPVVLHAYLAAVARSSFSVECVYNDTEHYWRTCKAWAERLDRAQETVSSRWGPEQYRKFRLYLRGSVAGFSTGLIQAYRWVLGSKTTA